MDRVNVEEHLIDFLVISIKVIHTIPEMREGNYLAGQLIRSGSSPDLNYGEARRGESRKDFLYKMKVSLKNLRESFIPLRMLLKAKITSDLQL